MTGKLHAHVAGLSEADLATLIVLAAECTEDRHTAEDAAYALGFTENGLQAFAANAIQPVSELARGIRESTRSAT